MACGQPVGASKQSLAVRLSVRARPQFGSTSSSHTRALRWIRFSRFAIEPLQLGHGRNNRYKHLPPLRAGFAFWRAWGRPTGAFHAPRDTGVVGGVVDAYKPGPGPLI